MNVVVSAQQPDDSNVARLAVDVVVSAASTSRSTCVWWTALEKHARLHIFTCFLLVFLATLAFLRRAAQTRDLLSLILLLRCSNLI